MAGRIGPGSIGTQVWMLKNLDVDTYRNGDPIPEITDATTWNALTTGAWCWYNNDSANGAIYGKLYNWYAVTDSRGLAPQGWHVPSDTEWTTLSDYLGGSAIAGGLLKDTDISYWTTPNTGATNITRFTALPGGARGASGGFVVINNSAYFWSTTENIGTPVYAYYRSLSYANTTLSRISTGTFKQYGLSVRIIKD
jgi:uncharacterized protein (TIGR02145 family)